MEETDKAFSKELEQERILYNEAMIRWLERIDQARSEAEMRRAVYAMLREIGRYTGAERVYLFDRIQNGPELYANTYEWCAPGVVSYQEELSRLTESDMPVWLAAFRNREPVWISDLEAVREAMPRDYEVL